MKIPIKAAKQISKDYKQKQVIIFGWDGKETHVTTYGKTTEDCDIASQGANEMKENWGWPDKYMGEPSRVTELKDEIEELKRKLSVSEKQNEIHEKILREQ